MNKILFVIDMQYDHFPMGMLEVKDTATLPARIINLMADYEGCIFFSANYPANHIRFAANHPWRKPGQELSYQGQKLLLYPIHSIEGSLGAELHPSILQETKKYPSIRRGADFSSPPSSLWDKEEELLELMQNYKEAEVHLCGVETSPQIWQNSQAFLEEKGYTVTRLEQEICSELLPFDY